MVALFSPPSFSLLEGGIGSLRIVQCCLCVLGFVPARASSIVAKTIVLRFYFVLPTGTNHMYV